MDGAQSTTPIKWHRILVFGIFLVPFAFTVGLFVNRVLFGRDAVVSTLGWAALLIFFFVSAITGLRVSNFSTHRSASFSVKYDGIPWYLQPFTWLWAVSMGSSQLGKAIDNGTGWWRASEWAICYSVFYFFLMAFVIRLIPSDPPAGTSSGDE